MIIGIDFDNTIVNYDNVFFHRAVELGWIKQTKGQNKKQIRDQIRLLPDGEVLWQKLQGYVYTEGMVKAHLIEGVKDFFAACQRQGISTYIISHKTIYSPFASTDFNLRHIALDWMKNQGFFSPRLLGLMKSQIYFESTRSEKIERLKALGCTHFIDDLQEVFLESEFPFGVQKILYAPQEEILTTKDVIVLNNWKRIHEHFFNR